MCAAYAHTVEGDPIERMQMTALNPEKGGEIGSSVVDRFFGGARGGIGLGSRATSIQEREPGNNGQLSLTLSGGALVRYASGEEPWHHKGLS